MLREIDIPPLWLGIFAALGWLVARAVPVALPYGAVAGWGLIALGGALVLVAAGQMVLRHTTFIPRRDPSALVTGGAFALSRNPIYLGDALVLTGFLLINDGVLALPLVPGFMLLITRRYILGEESRILATFGDEYAAYCRHTRRWL